MPKPLAPLESFEVIEEGTTETQTVEAAAAEPTQRQMGLKPLDSFEVIAQDETELVHDEKRGGTYEVPAGLSPRETNYVLDTEIDKKDPGQFFGLVDMGQDFMKDFAAAGFFSVGAGDNAASDAGENFFKGAVARAIDTTGQIGGLLKEQGEVGGAGLFATPGFIEGLKIAQMMKKDTKIIPRTPFDDLLLNAGQGLIDVNKEINESFSLGPTDDKPFNKFFFDLGSGATSVATSVGLLYLTKNPSAVGILFGALQKGEIFNKAREKGKSPEEASGISSIAGAIEGGLEALGASVFLKAVAFDKVLTRTLLRAGEEGLQEIFQQSGEELVTKFSGLRNDDFNTVLLRIAYAGLLGSILGAPAGAAVSIAEKQGTLKILTDQLGLSPEKAKEAIRNISAKTLENKEAQNALVDMIMDEVGGVSMTKEERKARAAEVKKEMDAQLQKVFEKAPDTEGTIKPGFENAILQGRIATLDKESADILKEIDQLEAEQKLRKEAGKPVQALENKLTKLVDRYNVVDSELAELLIERDSQDVQRSEVTLDSESLRRLSEKVVKQSKKIQERVAKIATIEERKRLREVQKTLGQIKRSNIQSLPVKERAEIEALQKQVKNVKTLEGLRQLNDIIQEIKEKGKEKNAALKDLKDQLFQSRKDVLIGTLNLSAEKIAKTQATKRDSTAVETVKALTLRSPRLLDWFDGGQDFKGPFYQIFYGLINKAFNNEVAMTNRMQAKGLEILTKHNIKSEELAMSIKAGNVTVTLSEAMHIYAATGNEENLAAIIHGNDIPLEVINEIIAVMPKKFRDAAEDFIAEFDSHYDRLRLAYIDFTDGQRDLPRVKGVYVPMRRQNVTYETAESELEAELADRVAYRKVFAQRQFTKERAKNLSEEKQVPIFLGLVETYFYHTTVREHFIAMGKTIKELQRLRGDRELAEGIKEKFGPEALKSFELYLDRVAQPHIPQAVDFWPKLASTLRQRAAIVHLAWNVAVMMKQPASIVRFLGEGSGEGIGPMELTGAIRELLGNWDEKIKFIHDRDPQMKNRQITRELEELKKIDPKNFKALNRLRDKFAQGGFSGIVLLDQFTTHAGWLAAYNKALRDGFTESEAIEIAQTTVLRTQPAAGAKDVAKIYGTNAFVDLMLQFTDQLSQDWNAITYDIPNRIKMGRWKAGFLGLGGMALQLSLIWMLTHGRIPTDLDDVEDMFWDFLSIIPIIGPMMNGLRKGYDVGMPAAVELVFKAPKAVFALRDGNIEKFLDNAAYFAAAYYKVPYTQIRRSVMGVTDLSDGSTEDFRRLVWSEAALEKE